MIESIESHEQVIYRIHYELRSPTHLTDNKQARDYELAAWTQGQLITLVHEPILGSEGFRAVHHQLALPLDVSDDEVKQQLRSIWVDPVDGDGGNEIKLDIQNIEKRRVNNPDRPTEDP